MQNDRTLSDLLNSHSSTIREGYQSYASAGPPLLRMMKLTAFTADGCIIQHHHKADTPKRIATRAYEQPRRSEDDKVR